MEACYILGPQDHVICHTGEYDIVGDVGDAYRRRDG